MTESPFWHFVLHTEWLHLVLYYAVIAIIGGMPAPTATSGIAYQWMFKSFNIFGGNIARATSTAIEKSPNFQDAVNTQQVLAGQLPTTVVPPPESKG